MGQGLGKQAHQPSPQLPSPAQEDGEGRMKSCEHMGTVCTAPQETGSPETGNGNGG